MRTPFASLVLALALFAAPGLSQTVNANNQDPWPGFADFPLCSMDQIVSDSPSLFSGQCVNPFTGEVQAWGDDGFVLTPGSGSYYTVLTRLNASMAYGCGISRADFSVECWGNVAGVVNNVPAGISAFRVTGGNDFACALTFDEGLLDQGHLTLLNPNNRAAFWASIGSVCWGNTATVSIGTNNPADPFADIVGFSNSVCTRTVAGSVVCTGTMFDSIEGQKPADEYVPSGPLSTIVQAGDDIYCGTRSSSQLECFGLGCETTPGLFLCASVGGATVSVSETESALSISNTRACYLEPDGTVSCIPIIGVDPNLPPNIDETTVFRQLYTSPALVSGMAASNSVVTVFGDINAGEDAFNVPIGISQAGCRQTDPFTLDGLELVSANAPIYTCSREGDYVKQNWDWEVSSLCLCFATQIDSLYVINQDPTQCGVTAGLFLLRPLNFNDPNCAA
eukprot:CAMPEP_0174905868 /NCGR_PEP_ID=MMETSP0167-20121228/54526_1 /TAXON_ID=38298 /ORGANISM="Rhodella maculata, Strain CCMP736" /LENGTH=450 /DNA_ID=CAMNT_0016148947 /DNA_START=30 /DNA_END=1382 /DNA_ORIENTATION=-